MGTLRTKHPLYWLWNGMKQRCSNPNMRAWKWYGGKGVRVCERWLDFDNFVADVSPRPHGTTLDRIDGNGDYEPSNCRWASYKEQGRNKEDAVFLVIEGNRYLACELAEISGHKQDTIVNRVKMGLCYTEVIAPRRLPHSRATLRGILAHNEAAARATHCHKGHEFTPENTIRYGHDARNRRCRACHRDTVKRYKQRKAFEASPC